MSMWRGIPKGKWPMSVAVQECANVSESFPICRPSVVYLADTKSFSQTSEEKVQKRWHKVNWELIECRQRPKKDRYSNNTSRPAPPPRPCLFVGIWVCVCVWVDSICVCFQLATTSAKVFSNLATLGPWGWFLFFQAALKRGALYSPAPFSFLSLFLFGPLSFSPMLFHYPWMLSTLLIAAACRSVGVVCQHWHPADVGGGLVGLAGLGVLSGWLGGRGHWCSETEINL